MNAIKFLKYDLRRSKYLILLSVLVFIPLGFLMGYNSHAITDLFSYMGLVAMIVPATMFSYEQKADCGFDNLLPATDMERVTGRFLTGGFFILFELALALIFSQILGYVIGEKITNILAVVLIFIGITLIYLSILNTAFFIVGRGMNQQIKSVMMILPAMILWGVTSSLIEMFGYETASVIIYIMEHLEMLGAIMVAAGIAMNVAGIFLCTSVIKKKDIV